MPNTNSSTLTIRAVIQYARTFDWAIPTVGLAGFENEPALSFAQDIVFRLMNKANPWKWNSYLFPTFYTQPYQQDYPTSISQNTLGWLESATMIDVNNTQQPKPQPPVRCVARLLPTSKVDAPTEICWIPNRNAILGTWPGNAVTYTSPLVLNGVGGPGSNPFTAIKDPNGNIQVVTQYGTTAVSGNPAWPAANATAGTVTTDGSVQWTVQDPNGVAIRLNALATFNSVVWQLDVSYQQKPPLLTSTSQTFTPIPDDLNPLIKQGFLAWCRKKVDNKLFLAEYTQWMTDIQVAMEGSDREPQEFGIYPATALSGGGSTGVGTYGYPGWPGWSSGG